MTVSVRTQKDSDRKSELGLRQADGFGDFGLKVDLENQVADETRHKEELERIIAGWDER
jgi:hypothetical protein